MKSTLSAKRKGDALVTVCQNNTEQKIEVVRMNKAAEKLIGYSAPELIGQSLDIFLPERIVESIHDYVEYDNPNCDFASVVRKIPNFQVLSKKGDDVPVSLRVFHLPLKADGNLDFELFMRDMTLIKRMEELKSQIAGEGGGAGSGISTAQGVTAALDISYMFVENDPIEVSFAIAAIDGFDQLSQKYAPNIMDDIVNMVAVEIKNTLRDDDTVGYLGEGAIGAVLLDCSGSNARSVLSRIVAKINNKDFNLGFESVHLTLSVAYTQIHTQTSKENLYNGCIDGVIKVQNAGGNMIHGV